MKVPFTETRESRTTSVPVNVVKTVTQIVLFWGFFLGVLPALVLALEEAVGLSVHRFPSPALRVVAVAVFTVFGSIGTVSGLTFAIKGRGTPLPLDATTRFVVMGAYRYVRNPMAVCGIMQGVCVGLWFGSLPIVLYALAGIPAWHWLARPWEERDLLRRFGPVYEKYRDGVPLWIPRLTPWEAGVHDHEAD